VCTDLLFLSPGPSFVVKGAKFQFNEEFRVEYVYTEAVDIALKPHLATLQGVFDEYSTKRIKGK
jgi:hypothetical protein